MTGRRIFNALMIAGVLSLGGLGLAACGQTKETQGETFAHSSRFQTDLLDRTSNSMAT